MQGEKTRRSRQTNGRREDSTPWASAYRGYRLGLACACAVVGHFKAGHRVNIHCQPLQSTAVLAGRGDYSHDCSPRDDRAYNHPPAALLVLNWWTMSLSGVKLGNMS